METNEKINIAEILKNCQEGTLLYCTIYGDVEFIEVRDTGYAEMIFVNVPKKGKEAFYDDGRLNRYYSGSECVLFPSKENRDWSRFQRPFKDGDILTKKNGAICIYKCPMYFNKQLTDFYCGYRISDRAFVIKSFNNHFGDISQYRFATEEEKAKLFQAIKDNGYKWNAEAKTLEKLIEPKFKVGDIITDEDGYKVRITEVNLEDECYGYESMIAKGIGGIGFSEQENWELVPNKFDIANLKPFDKVLVRPDNRVCWECDFFSSYDSTGRDFGKFHCVGGWYKECIPYEGNEHLLGTTNDCSDFYKTWE